MGKLQEILTSVLPGAWAASLEAESRDWYMQCPCGAETSIWDMGGVRWLAAGSPSRIGTCGACGRKFVGAVYRGRHAAAVEHRERPPEQATVVDADSSCRRPRESDRGQCLLWIDGVGCWLVCLKDRVTIGGPRGSSREDTGADIQLLADLSRCHATIARCGESYLLAADGPATISGKALAHPVVLRDGDLVGLGRSAVLRFRQPNRLSLTARLEFASDHRPARRIDGVLLMDQSSLLGPTDDCHIVCPEWDQRVLVFQRDGRLWCKLGAAHARQGAADVRLPKSASTDHELFVNGCRVQDVAPLRDGTIITHGDSRLRIEMPVAAIV